jgi:hypothetical protein
MPAPNRRKEVGISKEIDVRMNPRFVERQRNRFAARGVALIILINSIAAIALLVGLAHGAAAGQNLKSFADAMMVFGVGAAAGLASVFFAYLRRLLRMERPQQDTTPLRWLAVAAAIAGAVCFVAGLGVARNAVSSEKTATSPADVSPDTNAAAEFGTAGEAKAMLEKAVAVTPLSALVGTPHSREAKTSGRATE